LNVRLLGSSYAAAADAAPEGGALQYLTSFVVDERLALDAGSLGFCGTPEEQIRIREVFLTHSHIDHVASLPVFLENVFVEEAEGVRIRASAPVLESLRCDLFNDRIWPDFVALSRPGRCFLVLEELAPGETVINGDLRLTAIPVDHVVPTVAYLVESEDSGVLFVSDTGPTDEVWRVARAAERLDAVVVHVAFPDSMEDAAELTQHLTPRRLAGELRKLGRPVRVLAAHMKSRHREEVLRDLSGAGLQDVEPMEPGRTYDVSTDTETRT